MHMLGRMSIGLPRALADDGIHPNQAGQRLVYALLTSRIVEVAARTRAPVGSLP
jgi:lysophospholipase L1-like esterase